jgi:guanylate kinase
MLILSSPSGAGKTTIARELLSRNPALKVSISATTRAKRPNEVEGRDYIFVEKPQFEAMIAEDAFLEYATVFKHYYGTPRAPVEAALARGEDMLFDIDWQGAQQIKLLARKDMVSVFILPPSMRELQRRLTDRSTDAADVIQYRMEQSMAEISHWGEYDYIVINDDMEKSIADIQSILTAEKLRRNRQTNITEFIRSLGREMEQLYIPKDT